MPWLPGWHITSALSLLPFRTFNFPSMQALLFLLFRGFCVTYWLEEGEAHARKENSEAGIILLVPSGYHLRPATNGEQWRAA